MGYHFPDVDCSCYSRARRLKDGGMIITNIVCPACYKRWMEKEESPNARKAMLQAVRENDQVEMFDLGGYELITVEVRRPIDAMFGGWGEDDDPEP